MTIEEMVEFFEKNEDKFLEGDVKEPKDLAAFTFLQILAPVKCSIISAAEHNEFWLCFDEKIVAENITEDGIIFLIQCGIRYEEDMGFSMFA